MAARPRRPVAMEPIERELLGVVSPDVLFGDNPWLRDRVELVLDATCKYWDEIGLEPDNSAWIDAAVLFFGANENAADTLHKHLTAIAPLDKLAWMKEYGAVAVRVTAIWVVDDYA